MATPKIASKANIRTILLTTAGVMLAGAIMNYMRGNNVTDKARLGFN